jgi:hypothetical protein
VGFEPNQLESIPPMSSHPLYWLAFLTFLLVLGFLIWNRVSVHRNQVTGGKTSGLGGPNDPMA